jgi:hypothetical protein
MRENDPQAYHNAVPGLGGYYLEGSYVLGIRLEGELLTFNMDLVLTEQHPDWQPPQPTEQHCYRKGQLVFEGVTGLVWTRMLVSCPEGPVDEWDFGEMDVLRTNGEQFEAEGQWGQVRFRARNVRVRFGLHA